MKDKYTFPALPATAKAPESSDVGSGEIGWLLTMGALPQEGHNNISSPCVRLPISLLCRLPS